MDCPEHDIQAVVERLEDLRFAIHEQDISMGELAELADLAPYIHESDVELLQWAGVPEFATVYDPDGEERTVSGAAAAAMGRKGEASYCEPNLDDEDSEPHWHRHQRWGLTVTT
jgi:hypothetical protein